MQDYDIPVHKAVHFDLSISALSKYYSKRNPKHGYSLIGNFLIKNGYIHAQYSGYKSNHPTTDMKVFDLIRTMQEKMPWLDKCARKFEVSNLTDNHDLMKVLNRNARDPKMKRKTTIGSIKV